MHCTQRYVGIHQNRHVSFSKCQWNSSVYSVSVVLLSPTLSDPLRPSLLRFLLSLSLSLSFVVWQHLLAQSDGFLSSLANSTAIAREPTFDSASACAMVGTDVSKAAVASRRAAEAHGLVVLKTNFADVESETRYVILALNTTPSLSSHRLGRRCTVSYVLANRAGAMFKSLSCFAFRDLNIIKVSSVPLGGKQSILNGNSSSSSSSSTSTSSSNGASAANRWDYCFVVDFIASANDEVNKAALESLKEFANSVRILGEYSAAEMRNESPSKNMHHLAAF